MEEFRDIKGYEGLYKVSDLGRVKSLKRIRVNKDRILKNTLDSTGYLKVSLSKNSKGKNRRVHQLVAEAFLNHKPNKTHEFICDHRDNNPLNNKLENLQITTTRENTSKDRKGTSKFAGVSLDKVRNKWISTIRINGKKKFLGRFTDELKASEAYQTALKELL